MADRNPDEEPEAGPPSGIPDKPQPKGRRQSFGSVRRDLSEKELASPGVQKTLLDEIERLDSDIIEYKSFQKIFHEADKKVAILEQKFKTNTALEIISASCLAVGGLFLGYAPKAWDHQPTGSIFLAAGALLIVAGVVAKVVKA